MLVCGSSMHLLGLGTIRAKWRVIFVGFRPGRYLMVEMPRAGGVSVKLDEGTMWSTTFLNQGRLHTFSTEVLGYTYRLTPILFLSYPTEVEVSNLRSEKRYPVNIPLTFKIKSFPPPLEGQEPHEVSENQHRGLVADISENGFLMATTVALPPETVIACVFYLPGEEPVSGLLAVSRACRAKPGGFSVGMAYLPANLPETIGRLNSLINHIENIPLRL